MKKEFCIIIPAIKKNAVIPDQLIKKLDGETLIQRSINTAIKVSKAQDIFLITDSYEIALIAERNSINVEYDSNLEVSKQNIIQSLNFYMELLSKKYKYFILYRANTPLINDSLVINAYNYSLNHPNDLIISVKKEKRRILKSTNNILEVINFKEHNDFYEEVKAFQIGNFDIILKTNFQVRGFELDLDSAIEINSYQSWWICEKLLRRKRIVFNVIGSNKVGTGHIFRSLSLAHEITDHEIIFVCDEDYLTLVEKIAATDYKVMSAKKKNLTNLILNLNPDLILNDILNTKKVFMMGLKKGGAKIVNFEDLGSGSAIADLTINELYEYPQMDNPNYLWGHEYFFLRDEFNNAKPHEFTKIVDSVLITFGGTDQNNYTKRVLDLILPICEIREIHVYIVCGVGFQYKDELKNHINSLNYKKITFEFSSGIISSIMERTQIAICSNGRTVYELADMNIPAIVMSHHERENTHSFANLERGFINLGIFEKGKTEVSLKNYFIKLVEDEIYRKLLFLNVKKFNFRDNKSKVLNKILTLIEK